MTPKLTAVGRNLLLRALAGDELVFTKVKLGNGAEQDPETATDLRNALVTLGITDIDIGTNYITLVTTFSNSSVTAGFHITEAGFYVEDPDNEGVDVLYALGCEPESSADYIPAAANRIVEMQYNALIFIGDAENVSAAISSSLVYITRTEFDAHLEDHTNPHAVTKEQVGLANVPNVTTNAQTPTYTEAANLTGLTSGEQLTTAFGKLKKAVAQLIDHLRNVQNPHHVTAAQTGAAASSHTHNASNINAGILPVNRGGTGCSTLAELKRALEAIVTSSYITLANRATFFNYTYSSYDMTNASGYNWTFNNINVDVSNSYNYFTALRACKVTVRYNVSLEKNYDYLYLYVNGTQKLAATYTISGVVEFTLSAGQQFYFQLHKDTNQAAITTETNTASVTIFVEEN